ncbi:LacI family DNA-binding transcriptional regulator [Mycoplasma sp. P36-A1]|uniref:LacI family DNA-binding transcriptional regulator n=1 Tax=Mycoplasma sp. P36-A1 TaxID=3252900 RepID=UPI003C3096B4
MSNKVTIYDVAKKADVSLATVSRVINNSASVKQATKERVLEAIKELNFVPNAVAQGLASNKTTNIALIVPEASFSYISKIINGVVDVVYIYNYNVILHSTNFGQFEIDKIVDRVVSSRTDGVIILSSELTTKALDQFSKYNIPVTIVGTTINGPLRTSVYVDYEKVCYESVKDYLDKGKDKIYFIDGDYNRFIVSDMLTGIKRAYKDKGLRFKGHLKVSDSFSKSYEQLKKHMQENEVDLYLGARDSLAIAAMNAALDLNKVIPDDLEIIGFNNTKYSRMSRPQLSTIHVPLYEMGAIAARHMTKLLNNEEVTSANHELDCYLIKRESTK